jgi:hypothetical protein
MPSRETVPPSARPPRTGRWLSRALTTVALLVLVLGAAFVVVVIRRAPAPQVSPDSTTSIATPTPSTESAESAESADSASSAGAGAGIAPPTGSTQPSADSGDEASAIGALAGSSDEAAGSSVLSTTTPKAPTTTVLPAVPTAQRVSVRSKQLGIQVYLHEVTTTGSEDYVDSILDYVVGLGANSVAITFPLYTDGPNPSRVYADVETPSATRVRDVVARAHDRGLRVTVRPLIDEANIATSPGEWRGSIEPIDVGAWFDSYGEAVRPYFGVGADEFVLAAELNSLQDEVERWGLLDHEARAAFPGVISYTFNWDGFDTAQLPTLSSYGIDLYPLSDLDDDATVEELTAVMRYALGQVPEPVRRSLVIQEVGIPALSGAYRLPYHWGTEGGPIIEEIQAKWFTAACRAADESAVQGLYFWMLDSNIDPLHANPADQPPKSFIGRLAETSIRDCFAR